MSCRMTAEQYCTLTTLKIAIARYHLEEFERLVHAGARARPSADPESAYAPIHGHADAAVVETFAAFDTFSCAIAHKLAFKGADEFSLKRISKESRVSPELFRRVVNTVATDRWKRLESLRNLAGHRAVVTQHMAWGSHLPGGFQVFLADPADPNRRGDEFLPVMSDLLRWSEGRLRFLFNGVCREAFTGRGRIRQLRGRDVRAEVGP